MKVVKFGGSSLADAGMMRRAADILKEDPERRFAVVSAPGKRFAEDIKITDMLLQADAEYRSGKDPSGTLSCVKQRFLELTEQLNVPLDIESEFEIIQQQMKKQSGSSYLASRGEYLSAKIFALLTDRPFIDAADLIVFNENHFLNEADTYRISREVLSGFAEGVIPGFYGRAEDGGIMTFSRGGSDVTGSITARAVKADLYENWTDVEGIMSADPRIIDHPRPVKYISYRELRELSYMGASVLHEDAVFPLKNTGIPIRVCSTMNPEAEGTYIMAKYPVDRMSHPVTGIAGKKGFSNLQIEKAMMNAEIGFGARVLNIIASHGISYEHTPTSIDIISVIAETAYLEAHRNEIITEIDEAVHPDRIFIQDGMALVAVVGEGISANVGVAASVLQSIADAGINVRMIDAGCSELNIIIGVGEDDYEKTIHALYHGLYKYF